MRRESTRDSDPEPVVSVFSQGARMGASGRILLGFSGFFLLFPGVGLAIAFFFIGLSAWEAKEYTALAITHVLLIPWFIVTALTLIHETVGWLGLAIAYGYSFITGSILVFLPMVEDFQEMGWLSNLSQESLEEVGLFAVFLPMFLILLGWATHPSGLFVGEAMRELIKGRSGPHDSTP